MPLGQRAESRALALGVIYRRVPRFRCLWMLRLREKRKIKRRFGLLVFFREAGEHFANYLLRYMGEEFGH